MRRKRINNVLYRLPADDREALMAALDGVIIYSTYKGRPVMLVPDDYRWYGSTESKA
jgi:hypothetical protein